MKKITIILSFALILALAAASVYAASVPSKVKGVKASPAKKSVMLKWKKTRNAKKYQVFMTKGKKLKKVKTTKARKAVIKKLKSGKKYVFKVRGINGSKAGKYSKAVRVKTLKKGQKPTKKKTSKGSFHSTPIKADNLKPSKLKEGDTYVIQSDSGEKEKVTITSNNTYKGGYNIYGETDEGGEFIMSYDKSTHTETYIMINDIDYKYADQDWTYDNKLYSDTLRFKIKDNDTKVYFTLDGTEPKVGQADLVGKSKMVAFMKSLEEQVPIYYETPIRGTFKGKGTHLVNTGDNTVNKNRCCWFKVYRNSKLLNEFKQRVTEQ